MAAYAVSHQTPAGTDLGLINLTGTAAVRLKLYDLLLGSDDTPADAAGEFVLNRSTSVGTGGSALTEQALDPLTDTPLGTAIGGTFSGQPADTGDLLMIALNQRATFRWVAAPGGEIIAAAAANEGLFLRSVGYSTGTPNMNASMHWKE